MPSPIIVRFPYDPTGVNPDNSIQGEIHSLTAHAVRAVAPTYGPFFTTSLQVYDNGTDQLLVKGTDYEAVEMLEDITLRLGKEVCNLILILNQAVSAAVRINYQVVGGLYQNSAAALINMYETVLQDNRPVAWENILNKPLLFPPTTHLHNLQDVYGFEPMVGALERVRNAIVLSDVPAFEALIDWVNAQVSGFSGDIITEASARIAGDNALSAALQQEINNRVAGDNNLSSLLAQEIIDRTNADLTKVQQGGGVGQLNNVIKMGWGTNSRVKVTVDSTDMGNIVFDGQLTGALGSYLPLSGGTMTGLLTGNTMSMAMSQDGGAAKGSFVARASGAGDSNLAGMTFWNDAYAIKLGVRADGYFGLGGWSRGAWSWYSDPSGNVVSAGNMGGYSDPRLKDDFESIVDPFGIINAIEGFTFTWNSRSKLVENKWGKRDIGFKSTDVEKVLPMAVTPALHDTDTGETYSVVDYQKVIPVHNEALKILEKRLTEVESRVSFLSELQMKYETAKASVKSFISDRFGN